MRFLDPMEHMLNTATDVGLDPLDRLNPLNGHAPEPLTLAGIAHRNFPPLVFRVLTRTGLHPRRGFQLRPPFRPVHTHIARAYAMLSQTPSPELAPNTPLQPSRATAHFRRSTTRADEVVSLLRPIAFQRTKVHGQLRAPPHFYDPGDSFLLQLLNRYRNHFYPISEPSSFAHHYGKHSA